MTRCPPPVKLSLRKRVRANLRQNDSRLFDLLLAKYGSLACTKAAALVCINDGCNAHNAAKLIRHDDLKYSG